MKKIAFVFPGQGSQYLGMGKELYDNFIEVRDLYHRGNEILDEDIMDICFNGPEEDLQKTINTQPTILLTSLGAMTALMNNGVTPHMVAGLSLGEYSALVASEAIGLEDALPLVRKRGQFMQDAVPLGLGAMAAIIGLTSDKVDKCCKAAQEEGLVVPANYNCPGQIVISGHKEAVLRAMETAKDMGAKRALLLPVSAPFHSPLLQPAGLRLEGELKDLEIKAPKYSVVNNVYGEVENNPDKIRKNLVLQVTSVVRWQESMEFMIDEGISIFIEVGPSRVLSGFTRRISRNIQCFNVENMASLEKTLQGLGV